MLKKKILIFTSKGGGGHLSASQAISEYVDHEKYNVSSAFIFGDVLKKFDFIQTVTRGKCSGEDFYNFCMRRKWFKILNIFYSIGRRHFHWFRSSASKVIDSYIDQHKPDIIISVVPIVNRAILDVAHAKNIPFLVIPTDLDVTTFINGISDPHYKKFIFGVPFDYEGTWKTLAPARIPQKNIRVSGFPVRKAFLEQSDRSELCTKWNFPTDKPIIMIMMGARGSMECYTVAPYLAQISNPAHLVFCIGSNDMLRAKIESVHFPLHISVSIIGFTTHISEIMQTATMILTKSGSVSFAESIYVQLPMILDATTTILAWERLNHIMLKEKSLGEIARSHAEIPHIINRLLQNRELLSAHQYNLQTLPKKDPSIIIPRLIEELLI